MSDFGGLFENFEIDDSQQRTANRKATAVANLRVKNAFQNFLRQARSKQERTERFGHIKDDLAQVVAEACREAGVEDVDSVRKGVIQNLMSGLDDEPGDLTFPKEWADATYPKRPRDVIPGEGFPEEWLDPNYQPPEQEAPEQAQPEQRLVDPSQYSGPRSPGQDRRYGPPYPGYSSDKNAAGLGDAMSFPKRYIDYVREQAPGGFDQYSPEQLQQAGQPSEEEQAIPGGEGVPQAPGLSPNPEEVPTDTPGMEQTFVDKGMSPQDAAEEVGEYRHPQLPGQQPPWMSPENPELDPRLYSSTKEARPIQMCPFHQEVMNVSLAQGEPRAGYEAMASHWGGPQHCQGGDYQGVKCNFKREMTTQKFWDDHQKQLDEQREQRERQRQFEDEMTDRFDTPTNTPEGTDSLVEGEEGSDSEPSFDGSPDVGESLTGAPSAVGMGMESAIRRYAQDPAMPESVGEEQYGMGRDLPQMQNRKLQELQLALQDATDQNDWQTAAQIRQQIDRIQGQLGGSGSPPIAQGNPGTADPASSGNYLNPNNPDVDPAMYAKKADKDDLGKEQKGERGTFDPSRDTYRDEKDTTRSVKCANCGNLIPAAQDTCTTCGYKRGETVDKERDNKERDSSWRFADDKDGDSYTKTDDIDNIKSGPVPEIDKTTWQPSALTEGEGNLHPIDTDSGTSHPQQVQDKHENPDWNRGITEQTDAVTTQEPATTDTSISPETATSWENNGTNPVTNNPLSKFVSSQEVFPADSEIISAIRRFESR